MSPGHTSAVFVTTAEIEAFLNPCNFNVFFTTEYFSWDGVGRSGTLTFDGNLLFERLILEVKRVNFSADHCYPDVPFPKK